MGGNPLRWSCSSWMSVHLRHALAWPSVLFLDPVSPVSPTVTYTVCYCTPLWRWSPYRVDSMLHSQTPHQRRKNLDYIKVCSLTWGWAKSPSVGFVPSNASTSSHAAHHTSVEASRICTVLVAISAASHHCGLWTETSLLCACAEVTDVVTRQPGEAYNYVFGHGQSTSKDWSPQHCGYVSAQSSWPVVLASLSGVVTWDGGWEHFPACCDQFFQPRPP